MIMHVLSDYRRRKEREKIGTIGVPEVWGKVLPDPNEPE